LTEDGSQSSPIEFTMIGYNNLSEGMVPPKYDVTSVLALENEVFLEEYTYMIASGNAWQLAHTATSNASKRSVGIAKPSSLRFRTYASIASRIF
jgi:hypothetical protein